MVRPTSLFAVVLGVVIAMLAQLGTVVALRQASAAWLERLAPQPSVSATVLPTPSAPRSPSASGTSTSPPAQSTGPVEVTDQIKRGVVLISGRTPNEGVAGTGMVLTSEGLVLTNYHVVRSTQSISVTVASTGRRYQATLLGRDATKDVALLKLEGARSLDVVTIDRNPVRVGDIVVAAGNANGQGYVSAHRGNVLHLSRSINVRSASPNDPPERLSGLIETNAPAWPGDSGGPMFDATGEVLGMTTAGSSESETDKQVYAVPIATALQVIDQIKAGDESGSVVIGPKAYLGVVAQADDNAQVKVVRVESGTPAAQAGLRSGDTITSLNGQPIGSRSDLSTVLDGIEPGSTVPIAWTTSSGRERTASVTVAESQLN